jgi:DNA-directed RNA polymerase specialized sigma24 family protein
VAETWLQVVRGLRSFAGDEVGWRGWVFTIARHRVFDNSRTARRHREAVERQPQAREQYAADAADAALERLGTVRVLAAIARLPRMQAEVCRAAGARRSARGRGGSDPGLQRGCGAGGRAPRPEAAGRGDDG